MAIITLTTDLGTRDHYAASLRGALMRLAPGVAIVDVTHEISHFNLLEAAFVAKSTCPKFPPGSVHLLGVDPEGGTRIAIVAMRIGDQYYVAPDNGVLSLVREREAAEWVLADPERLPVPPHGRAFLAEHRLAPVAAALAAGKSLADIGAPGNIREYLWGEPSYTDSALRGVIVHIDHFGNAITNIRRDHFMQLKGERSFQIFIRNLRLQRIVGSYGDGARGDSLAIFGDNGHLEIALREGNAAKLLGLKVQDMVTIEFYG
jgi:S-adenosylmethionine hydrolase